MTSAAAPARRRRIGGRSLAVVAIAIAALGLTGCSLLGQLGNDTKRDASGTPTAANSDADVFTIRVGDCLDDATSNGTVTNAPIVPCTQPHDSEAYAAITMSNGKFPGDAAVTSQANEGCANAFPGFIGIAYDDSDLSISYYFPTQDSWDRRHDREILCTVYDDGTKTTGTLKNAKR